MSTSDDALGPLMIDWQAPKFAANIIAAQLTPEAIRSLH